MPADDSEGKPRGKSKNYEGAKQRQSEEIGDGETGDVPARGDGQQKRQGDKDQEFRKHLETALKRRTAAPVKRRPLLKNSPRSLVQLARQRGEGLRQIGADSGHASDDHDSDESGDQAILDGGGARFIANKTRDEIHFSLQL